MSNNLKYKWIDGGSEPECAPDPKYPDGKPICFARPWETSCSVDLPHPAPRIGHYIVRCDKCDLTVAVSTAGRPDDPSALTVPCKVVRH